MGCPRSEERDSQAKGGSIGLTPIQSDSLYTSHSPQRPRTTCSLASYTSCHEPGRLRKTSPGPLAVSTPPARQPILTLSHSPPPHLRHTAHPPPYPRHLIPPPKALLSLFLSLPPLSRPLSRLCTPPRTRERGSPRQAGATSRPPGLRPPSGERGGATITGPDGRERRLDPVVEPGSRVLLRWQRISPLCAKLV